MEKQDFSLQRTPIQIKKSKKILNNDGQSTVEFLLGFSFTVGILFVFISLGINYGVGYLNHYATFMASRVLLVSENSGFTNGTSYDKGTNQGRQLFNSFRLEGFGARNVSLEFNLPSGNAVKAFVGAYSNFTRPLSAYRPLGGGVTVNLRSESFLGKEPTRMDCFQSTCEALTGSRDGCNPNSMDVTLFDNGC